MEWKKRMERDHFKDRPESVQYNSKIYRGAYVFICLKEMQPKAKVISDLTLTKVTANLTTQWQHPRGQKIRGDYIEMDKYGNRLLKDVYEEVVGRCTYIVDDNLWSMDTSEGKKFLVYENNRLIIKPYTELKNYMKLYCIFRNKKASFKLPICRFVYFKNIESAQNFIDNLIVENMYYQNDIINFSVNGNMVFEDSYEMFLDNKKITNLREMYYYVDSISNGKLPMELEGYELEKII